MRYWWIESRSVGFDKYWLEVSRSLPPDDDDDDAWLGRGLECGEVTYRLSALARVALFWISKIRRR